MKYRLKESCLNFHINSWGKKKTLKLLLLKRSYIPPLKHSAFTFRIMDDVFLPKGIWMSLPQKPINARSKMAREVAAGRASWGIYPSHRAFPVLWVKGLPPVCYAMPLTQSGCLQLSSSTSDNDEIFSSQCRIIKLPYNHICKHNIIW